MNIRINGKELNTKETVAALVELWKTGNYYALGARADRRELNEGEELGNSHQLWQDDPGDGTPWNEELGAWDSGELPGTCAIKIACTAWLDEEEDLEGRIERAVEEARAYTDSGRNIYLIAGYGAEGGWDKHEVIIGDAVVVGKAV